MLLGKRYARMKSDMNSSVLKVTFERKDDGTTIELPRKLNMFAVLCFRGKINKKAVDREIKKFEKRRKGI